MCQKLIYYNQDACFSRIKAFTEESRWHEVDKFYDPYFYKNEDDFSIAPDDDILIIMLNCGSNWFGHGVLSQFYFNNTEFSYSPEPTSFRMCIWIKNICQKKTPKRNTTLHVPAGTPLSRLLMQSDIIYKLGFVSCNELAAANRVFYAPPKSLPSLPAVPTTFETAEEASAYYEQRFWYNIDDGDSDDDLTPKVRIVN